MFSDVEMQRHGVDAPALHLRGNMAAAHRKTIWLQSPARHSPAHKRVANVQLVNASASLSALLDRGRR